MHLSKLIKFVFMCVFSHSVFAAPSDVVYVDLGTPRAVDSHVHGVEQGEDVGVEEQKSSVKCSKSFMFMTVAGLATAAVGAYMLSTCEDVSFDVHDPDTFHETPCEDSLGAQLKDFGLIGAGVSATMTVLNWCGKKAGCHKSNPRTTDHDLARASVMISRL